MGTENEKRREDDKEPASDFESLSVFEKVRLALTKMGFRDAEARSAVAEVQRHHHEAPPIGEALREAVLAATAKCA